jgi:hypothetical protein
VRHDDVERREIGLGYGADQPIERLTPHAEAQPEDAGT